MAEEQKEGVKYEVDREGTERNLRIQWTELLSYPNLEYNPLAMEEVIDILIETGPMTTITFALKYLLKSKIVFIRGFGCWN